MAVDDGISDLAAAKLAFAKEKNIGKYSLWKMMYTYVSRV